MAAGDKYDVMLQSAYDANADGKVDLSQGLVTSYTVGSGGCRAFQVTYINGDGEIAPADSRDPTHAGKIVGMTLDAIDENENGFVQSVGEIVNNSWDLTPGAVYYLGIGEITAIEPRSGFSQIIGIAVDSVTLIIKLGIAIVLSS